MQFFIEIILLCVAAIIIALFEIICCAFVGIVALVCFPFITLYVFLYVIFEKISDFVSKRNK